MATRFAILSSRAALQSCGKSLRRAKLNDQPKYDLHAYRYPAQQMDFGNQHVKPGLEYSRCHETIAIVNGQRFQQATKQASYMNVMTTAIHQPINQYTALHNAIRQYVHKHDATKELKNSPHTFCQCELANRQQQEEQNEQERMQIVQARLLSMLTFCICSDIHSFKG